MFYIWTDATEEEKKILYRQYGLLDENDEFKDPQAEWLLSQFRKENAPDNTDTQKRRQEKLVEEINAKIQLYKRFIKERKALADSEEKSFEDLQIRWENERIKVDIYLHKPKSRDARTTKNILFQKLWDDLLQLKLELDELK
jgi:formyltetrahydrofolate hydrolase